MKVAVDEVRVVAVNVEEVLVLESVVVEEIVLVEVIANIPESAFCSMKFHQEGSLARASSNIQP